jgi:crotonobetainyl-CoA:carnitine CoA-transferase CaiB-like acyl-CoA transferase
LLARDGNDAATTSESVASEGQAVWTSLLNSACAMQAGFLIEAPGSCGGPGGGRDLRGSSPYHRAYACRDGWIFVSADAPEERDRLLSALGVTRDGDPTERIAAATAAAGTKDVLARLRSAGIAAVACPRFPALVDDPQIRANDFWWSSHHSDLGDVVQTGAVIELSRTPMRLGPVAPRLGEHTREILGEIGIDDATIGEWVTRRIARAAEPTAAA